MSIIKNTGKFLLVLLLGFGSNAHAFKFEAVDNTIDQFLNKWFEDQCSQIEYSYVFALTVDEAHKHDFMQYNPYKKATPNLPNDVLVKIETQLCDISIRGYWITLREKGGGLEVLDYSAFDQPE